MSGKILSTWVRPFSRNFTVSFVVLSLHHVTRVPPFRYIQQPIAQGCTIGHIRDINILTLLRGFHDKIANLLSSFCLSIPKRDLDT